MLDRQTELQARTLAITQQQERVRLLLPPAGVVSKDQLAEYLSEEDRAKNQTMQRLQGILEPYVLACHAAVTDMRGRRHELLYSQPPTKEYNPMLWAMVNVMAKTVRMNIGSNPPVGVLKYVQDSPIPKYSTFVSLKYRQIKLGDSVDYLCQSATFCEAPTTNARHVSSLFLNRHFDHGYTWGILPNPRNYLVHLEFGENGLMNRITALDNSGEFYTRYSIWKNSFIVGKGNDTRPWAEIPYTLGQDGRFRRAIPNGDDTLSIEDDIASILKPLPFAPFQVKSLQT